MCGCAPEGTVAELNRMDAWLSGQEVEGFPQHDAVMRYRYVDERYKSKPLNKEERAQVINDCEYE